MLHFPPRSNAATRSILALLSALTLITLIRPAPAQAGVFQRIGDIFKPSSDAGTAAGSRRGGGVRGCPAVTTVEPTALPQTPTETGSQVPISSLDDLLQPPPLATSDRTTPVAPDLGSAATVDQRIQPFEMMALVLSTADLSRDTTASIPDQGPIAAVGTATDSQVAPLLVGQTIDAHPSFWIYLSQGKLPHTDIIFSLNNPDEETVVGPLKLDLPDAPGFARIDLPTDQPELKLGQRYTWRAIVQCQDSELSEPEPLSEVEGFVMRVTPDASLSRELATLPSGDSYQAYFDHGLWYDMVNQLAIHHQTHLEDWQDLLTLLDLPLEAEVQGSLKPVVATPNASDP